MQVLSYKFGDFELDPARFELRRKGNPIKLERIPMELLILLAEKDGAVVSRQEIVERLWRKDVFVDTEHGINTAIRKIRTALREDAEKPRFVQTVQGKGYRFAASVSNGATVTSAEPERPAIQVVEAAVAPPSTPKRKLRWKVVAVVVAAVVVVIAASLVVWDQRREAKGHGNIQSIAVLPLANLSGDTSQDYFADGMTDELITMLARNTSLRVVSRTSVMQYKGVGRPLREIARELGADFILEGSVNRTANHVHLNLQLIRSADDSHVWAESYDRDVNQIYSFSSELAYTIAKQANGSTVSPLRQRYVSPEAHDAYLRGRYFWYIRNTERSVEFLQKAIELQPDYAAAWSGLADNYALAAVSNEVPPDQVREKAFAAAQKAAELDPAVAETHLTMAAMNLFLGWDWKNAEVESQKAVELNPNLAEVHHIRSYVLTVQNHLDEALKEEKLASSLDSFSRPHSLGGAYIRLRQFDKAIDELKLQEEAQPGRMGVHLYLADVYRFQGMQAEAAKELQQTAVLSGDDEFASVIPKLFQQGGDAAIAKWRLKQAASRVHRMYISPLFFATWHARAGHKEETLKYLEAAFQERTPDMIFVQYDPQFDFLHSEPRYRAIVEKMGLTPAY